MNRFLLVLIVAVLLTESPSAGLPESLIPVIGQRLAWWAWSPRLLCELAWLHMDGFEYEAYVGDAIGELMLTSDSTDLAVVYTPGDLYGLADLGIGGRAHYTSLGGSSAFIEANSTGSSIEEQFTSTELQDQLSAECDTLQDSVASVSEALWCWKLWDEPVTRQRGRIFDTTYPYDNYFPNLFPGAYPADTAMTRVDSASVFSWIKWELESRDSLHSVTTVLAGMPYISTWAGVSPHTGSGPVSAHKHADMMRAFCTMRHQDYPFSQGSLADNFPEMVQVDIYPFRLVGTEYQTEESYSPTVGDSLNTWLLDHCEIGMDSIFRPALSDGIDIHFFTQAFGAAGGEAMWQYDSLSSKNLLSYTSYLYRIPTPVEHRMLTNLALMHQAKGIFPYSLMSYPEGGWFSASLLDEDMVPWDAPFEEWCYRNRAQDSITYIRPDSLPPFTDGFDPLYEGPGIPPSTPGQRQREDYQEWKFEPYGRLWNSLGKTLSSVAFMAPELADLSWWEGNGHPELEVIACYDYCESWAGPECRVFADGNESSLYLFYVNRCCRDSSHIFYIGFDIDDIPFSSGYALDHSRRVIIPQTDLDSQEFSYTDTLGPGEARLVELIDYSTDAELRITSPDVYARYQGSLVDRREFDFEAGSTIEIYGQVYNLGTDDAEDVEITLTDLTTSTVLGRDTLDFDGLSRSGYVPDVSIAGFTWTTSSNDIGIHLLEIEAERLGTEDRRDNRVEVPFRITPRDYATEVRDDPWDMEEASSSPPLWKTNDIEAIAEDWLSTAWTDSVGGMFEGAIDAGSATPHRGELSLAIPSGGGYWIDADTYHLLSFAGTWFSPYLDEFAQCEMYARWRDSRGDYHGWFNLNSEIGLLKNGWNAYREVIGIDLTSVDSSWTGMIQELWLRVETDYPTSPQAGSIPVRLSWVRLEESGD